METPEKIPVGEAAARDLLACSVCGATGAGIRQAEGKKHFLCAACEARGRRWSRGAIVALVVVLGVVGWIRFRPSSGPAPSAPPEDPGFDVARAEKAVAGLMQARKYREAIPELGRLLKLSPDEPFLHLYLGECFINLGYFEASLQPFKFAMAGDPQREAECSASLGMALQMLSHSAQARPFLEKEFKGSKFEESRLQLLAECLIDLERYPEGLKILEGQPPGPAALRTRHRALVYMGRPDDARKVCEKADVPPVPRAIMLSLQLREEGDFEGALRLLREAEPRADPKSPELLRLKEAELQVYLEQGDLGRLEEGAAELAGCSHPITSGEARYLLVLGRLMAGKREAAVAAAREFLGKMDIELGLLRMESLIMQHLVGPRITTEVLATEASQLNRFRANDLYFYLALATGDASWAKKAAESTPGHNFPYHAIQRLAGK
ncbi:MAG TPA: tetratricopeptide repeat protein [Planctomycetota bacterium]|nr:tetratricopeptide repeat protein [Planctomycetota bacterium]